MKLKMFIVSVHIDTLHLGVQQVTGRMNKTVMAISKRKSPQLDGYKARYNEEYNQTNVIKQQ